MLEPGTVIRVELPDGKGTAVATVITCSPKGNNCRLQLKDGEEIKVNITKCAFTVVSDKAQDGDDQPAESEEHEGDDNGASDDEDDAEQDPALSVVHRLLAAVRTNPEALAKPSTDIATLARSAAKAIFDLQNRPKRSKDATENGDVLDNNANNQQQQQEELYVDGFDPEQIWLQLDMAAVPVIKKAKKVIKKADTCTRLLPEDVEEALDELLGNLSEDESLEDEEDEEEYSDDDDLANVDYEAMLAAGNRKGRRHVDDDSKDDDDIEDDVSEEEEEEEEQEQEEEEPKEKRRKKGRLTNAEARAAIEDDFMKLEDMEAFLRQAEEDAEKEDLSDEELREDKDIVDPDAAGDSDAELEALLDKTAALVGKNKKKNKKKLKLSEFDSDDDDDFGTEQDPEGYGQASYEDFFGPKKPLSKKQKLNDGRPKSQAQLKKQAKQLGGDDFFSSDEDDDLNGGFDNGDGGHSEDEDFLDDEEEDRQGSEDDDKSLDEEDYSDDDEEDDEPLQPSTHERRLAKMADRVKKLEDEAMAEKDWYLRGEVTAQGRPKNSALELDLEFETTVKPPPQPTEESTRSLEDLIKSRIAEGQFNDVVRVLPAQQAQHKSTTIELDDKKSTLGLGELYERDYVQAVTGAVEDKDEPVRQLAKAQFAALCAQLDQLAHMHYRPVPMIEEVTVKVDVPALMMEEAASAFVSTASMRAPEEVYRRGDLAGIISGGGNNNNDDGPETVKEGVGMLQADGVFKSEAELTREDRKRRRAAKKRGAKKHRAEKDAEKSQRAMAAGRTLPLVGRKSEEAEAALRKMSKRGGAGVDQPGSKSNFNRSAKVFANLQSARENGGGKLASKEAPSGPSASQYKL